MVAVVVVVVISIVFTSAIIEANFFLYEKNVIISRLGLSRLQDHLAIPTWVCIGLLWICSGLQRSVC